jgi:hypothetical protein
VLFSWLIFNINFILLGRATIERHTGHQMHAVNRTNAANTPTQNDQLNRNTPQQKDMRITGNPLNLNYADPEDAIRYAENQANALNGNVLNTDVVNHIPSPLDSQIRSRSHSAGNRRIDSTTYCKRDKNGRKNANDNTKSWQ